MTHIALGATGTILDHLANVIEGSGYRGVPGVYSNDQYLNEDDQVTASGSTNTTQIEYSSGAWPANYWVKANNPGFWLVCSSGSNAGAARKITAWNIDTPNYFETAAFPSNNDQGNVYTIAEGFKRIPEGVDIEEDFEAGYDRFYRLAAMPGEPYDYYGGGNRTYVTDVTLRLRMLKHHRDQDTRSAIFENLRILRDAITKQTNLETTYTRLFTAHFGADEITADDKHKVVAESTYRLIYRVSTQFD